MNVLLVAAHPCADSFTLAVAGAARDGLESAAHHVTTLDLYALGFDAAMSRRELDAYRSGDPPPDSMVRAHADLVAAAQVLVFVYPTWWSGLPAVLKGWLERVLVPGVAFSFDERGKIVPGLQHVGRIVGISTYGSPWTYVKLVNDNGRRTLMRALKLTCGGDTATTWLGLYSLDTTGDNERRAFLDRVHHTMSRLR
jgi:putative NADPH-quinone reductase